MRRRLRFVWASLVSMASVLDKDDVLLLAGLALVAGGLWSVSRPSAAAVPGLILLWIYIPSRPPLIERPPSRERRPGA